MRITLGTDVTRAGADETIAGLWSFANALGLLTDIIGERTADAGVTVDGVLLKDASLEDLVEVGITEVVNDNDGALHVRITGQPFDKFRINGNGQMGWGSGGGGIDAQLNRSAAGVLQSVQNFLVSGELRLRGKAAAATDVLDADVTGDSERRYIMDADGTMLWGSGSAVGDTNLFRAGADELQTDDRFSVGGDLHPLADLNLSSRLMTLDGTTTDDDVPTGTVTVQRVDPNGSSNISGLAGGSAGRMLILTNITGAGVGILSDNSGSVAANRILGPGNANFTLDSRDGVLLWYDSVVSRWKTISLNV